MKYLYLFILLLPYQPVNAQLQINEAVSANRSTLADEDGQQNDWIELYNNSSATLNLEGYSLTDRADEPRKWLFSATELSARNFLVVFASGKDRTEGELHTNFGLSHQRDTLYLFNPQNELVSQWLPACLPVNYSAGALPDGASNRVVFAEPSPGQPNSAASVVETDVRPDKLRFSQASGFYSEDITLTIDKLQPNNEIHYTLDGSVPTADSPLYTGGLFLQNRSSEKNDLSRKRTGSNEVRPEGEVSKGNVVRAAAFTGFCRASEVVTASYFVGLKGRYSLPVVSLVFEPDDLFDDDEGIYVRGNDSIPNFMRRGRSWERDIHFSFYNSSGEQLLEQPAGVRIHGASSRGNPQKNLRLYARESYGEDYFDYRFFSGKDIDQFKRLILQSSNNINEQLFTDALTYPLLHQKLDVDMLAAEPVIAFLNGEYWGIYYLRERLDEYFLEGNFALSPGTADIITDGAELDAGDFTAYDTWLNWLRSADLSTASGYAEATSRVDIDNYIDYLIAEIFFANTDWPFRNLAMWRPQQNAAKWRWIFFDCDRCFVETRGRTDHLLEPGLYKDWSILLFQKLMQNKQFRQQFYGRQLELLQTHFAPENTLPVYNNFKDLIVPELPEHLRRWQLNPSSLNEAEDNIDNLRHFLMNRPYYLLRQLDPFTDQLFLPYPQPASNTVSFAGLPGSQYVALVKVYTTTGQLVLQQEMLPVQSGIYTLDISAVEAGLYKLVVQQGRVKMTRTLLIEK
jgi:hypothetical protein